MFPILQDIVKATSGLDFSVIKVTSTDEETVIESINDSRDVILKGKTKEPVTEITGTFGLGNVSLLSSIINIPSFKSAEAKVSIKFQKKGTIKVPEEIIFDGSEGARVVYRLMAEAAIPKQAEFRGVYFDIEVNEPTRAKISEFASIANAYSAIESKFIPRVINGNLLFLLGEETTANHRASVIFATDVEGKLSGAYSFPVGAVLSILKLSDNADCQMRFADKGILEITVSTALATYEFILPGHQ